MKNFFFISLLLISFFPLKIYSDAFILIDSENSKILINEGDIEKRISPCSTFKIPLALMGFDQKILQNTTKPVWHYEEGKVNWSPKWKKEYNPTTWLLDSCAWYSQDLAKKIGIKDFQDYLNKFDYGNKDCSGDPGKNNGLTYAWLDSSLQITPKEQVLFIQKLLQNKLAASKEAHALTRQIIPSEQLENGWTVHGKTGTSAKSNTYYGLNRTVAGWYVGWISKYSPKHKKDIVYVFAQLVESPKEGEWVTGYTAKETLLKKLQQLDLINNAL